MSWSRTVRSRCPDTTGVSAASHAAASASGPVRYTDPGICAAAARAVLQPASSPEAPGWPRSSARSTCTVSWAGWLSGPGSIPESISRWQASSSASCCRWSRVRVSSGPPLAPSAASTAATAAAAGPVRSPERRPAPPMVVSSHTARSSNRSRSGIGGAAGPLDHLLGQRPQIRQPGPAAGGGQQDRVRVGAAVCGQLIGPLTQGPGPRAAQLPGASAAAISGCAASRRAHFTAPLAAPWVIVGDGPQPGRGPVLPIGLMPLLGAERGQQPAPAPRCAAPRPAPARSAPRPEPTSPGSAASQEDRYPSPARTIASACAVLDGAAGAV